ncbi:MAG: heavy metal-binding domain-containing protein [Chitinophagales bacterium]
MKSSIKILTVLAIVSTSFFMFSCNGEAQTMDKTVAAASDQPYTCPMHPEIGSDKPGQCSKCGMNLVGRPETPKSNYHMSFSATPETIEANKPVTFSFIPRKEADAKTIVNLEVVHTKKIHLIVVSSDLSFFNHIHPEQQPDGSYQVSETFPSGGNYILFADYTPTNGDHKVQRIEVNVNGKPALQKKYSATSLTSNVSGYEISVSPQSSDFVSNQMTMLNATVKKDGKEIPALSLDDYLGAKAHMVIVSGDGETYLHVHPELEDGKLLLHTEFPHEGMYRGWIQVQVNGKVLTGDFVFIVKQGETKGDGEMKMDHEHH